jgi:uncharacterized membrane protein
MAIILAYIFYFVAASASPLQRRWLAKKKDATMSPRGQISFAFHTVLILVLGSFFLPLIEPARITGDISKLIILPIICGFFGMWHFIFGYIAQRHVDAGVSSLVNNIYTPITIALSIMFLNEGLTGKQIVGTIILLVAMIIVAKKHRIGKFKFDKYFLMTVASGVMLGVLLVSERALQKTTGFSMGTMMSWGSQFLFLGLATWITKSKHTYTNKEVLTTGGLKFLQGLSWVTLVFIVGNLSVVSAVTTFKIVIVFILGALFLNEKEDLPRKILGSIIAVIGLLLMK